MAITIKHSHAIYHRCSYSNGTASFKSHYAATSRMRSSFIRIYICLKIFAHDEYFIIFYPTLRDDDGETAMMMIVLLSIIKKDNWTRYARSQYLTVVDYNSIAVATQKLRGNIANISWIYGFVFFYKRFWLNRCV